MGQWSDREHFLAQAPIDHLSNPLDIVNLNYC